MFKNSVRSASGRRVRNTAATIAPVVLPRPPATTITTTSMLFTKVNEPGLMIGTKWANSPPATPAKNEEMTKARTL